MIINSEDATFANLADFDVCIIGSGAAGLAIANELLNSNLRVAIVESGHKDLSPRNQSLFETENTGLPFQSAQTGRYRVIGGATTKWGGQSLPLDPSDFERRSWVLNSGWPFGRHLLDPYYQRANAFMLVDTWDYREDIARKLKYRIPDFNSGEINFHFSKWSLKPNLRTTYLPKISGSHNITLIENANFYGADFGLDSRIMTRAQFKTHSGRSFHLAAKQFVIAAGGIESTRLLLWLKKNNPYLFPKSSGFVGKFFQEHPAVRLGSVSPSSNSGFQKLFSGQRFWNRRYSVRLSLSEQAQRENRLLNASAGFIFSLPTNSDLARLRNWVKRDGGPVSFVAALMLALRNAFPLLGIIKKRLYDGYVCLPNACCEIAASFEQEPCIDSFISLSDDVDSLGMFKAKVNWTLTPKTLETAKIFAKLLESEFARLKLGKFEPAQWLKASELDSRENVFADQNHHMGSIRMGESACDSVVDSNVKMHELENLHVASAAVFPTSGHSNPTLTLIALSIRLADRLKNVLS